MGKYRFQVGETTDEVIVDEKTLDEARNEAYRRVPKGVLLHLVGKPEAEPERRPEPTVTVAIHPDEDPYK